MWATPTRGNWHRQVSLLGLEKIEAFRAKGADVAYGAFGENLVVDGFDFRTLPVGTLLAVGDVLLQMTQIGKECHNHCAIYKADGRLHHAPGGRVCQGAPRRPHQGG